MDWREEQVPAHVRERRPQLPIRNELGTVCEIEAMARLPSEEERTLSHLKFKDNTAGPDKPLSETRQPYSFFNPERVAESAGRRECVQHLRQSFFVPL